MRSKAEHLRGLTNDAPHVCNHLPVWYSPARNRLSWWLDSYAWCSVSHTNTRSGLGAGVFVCFARGAQQPPPATPSLADREGKKAEEVYKNIQVLQGTPAEDLIQTMHLIKGAIGRDCEYCHVRTAAGVQQAERDDLEPKQTARKMMKMVQEINQTQFGGAQLVTCYTCHRGSPVPLATPLLPVHFEPEKPLPDLPSVDEILGKYVKALGGEQAIRKVTSRLITATHRISPPGGRLRSDTRSR